jgi:hypothetical protein
VAGKTATGVNPSFRVWVACYAITNPHRRATVRFGPRLIKAAVVVARGADRAYHRQFAAAQWWQASSPRSMNSTLQPRNINKEITSCSKYRICFMLQSPLCS